MQATTYILRDHGPRRVTAQKVADRAGVNIGSFYQYFPNKQALLFHIAKQKWDNDLARLVPILSRHEIPHSERLRDFIREFFMIEAAEADVRHALRDAAVDLKDTPEYSALMAEGFTVTKRFIEDAMGVSKANDFDVEFIVTLVTSVAERTTDGQTSAAKLIRQADLLSDMITARFGIQ